ncbi:MAG: hypothetical protein ACKO38_05855 [Planctomycetota bacterium]
MKKRGFRRQFTIGRVGWSPGVCAALLVALVGAIVFAEPPPPRIQKGRKGQVSPPPLPAAPFEPARMLNAFFGPANEDERATLRKVEIGLEEERRVGSAAVEGFLADLRRRDIAVARDGRDVAYLEKLVERLRPRMRNAGRYPRIRVLVANNTWTDARSFPGGTLVFFRGLMEFAGSEVR